MEFDDIRDRIFPWIKQAIPLSGESGESGDGTETFDADCVSRPFLADLCLLFAIDREDCFELLRYSMLPPGLDDDALFAQAKKNLTEQVEFTLTGTSYGGLGILAGGDHEAGALCLDFIWDAVAKTVGEDLVVAVPAKDCLFMAVARDPEQVEAMAAIAKDIFENGDRVLTNTLFLFTVETREFAVYGSF